MAAKRFILITAILSIGGLTIKTAANTSGQKNPEAIAKEFVQKLSEKDFSGAVSFFDNTMAAAMPEQKLQQTWNGLLQQVGQFQKQVATRQQIFQQYNIVFVTCQFERSMLDIKVVLNSAGKVSGLFFVPSQHQASPPAKESLPVYVDKQTFREKELKIGKESWRLPGTLTLPKSKGPFTAVILVHGSGPHDRDETIGPNKPFRDIAWGLASNGIAVLRYEKRTKHYAEKMAAIQKNITVQDETIDDVLAAIASLKKIPLINKQRIFVLGHSLGGMLIPRIAQQDDKAAGFIVMAGSTIGPEDSIVNQYKYIFSLDGQIDEKEKPLLEAAKRQAALIKSKDLTLKTPSSKLPLGVSAAYWLDLRSHNTVKEATSIDRPILILQGQRDYQVTMEDFNGWKKALDGKKSVQYRLYPDLNHLFITGKGKCTPSEYEKPGHVDKAVIDDLVHWISN